MLSYKNIVIILLLLLLTGCVSQPDVVTVNVNQRSDDLKSVADALDPVDVFDEEALSESLVEANLPTTIEVPASLDLEVPFVSQAPLRNWDEPYDEACEEASMLSVVKYLRGGALDSQTINRELLTLIDWQEKRGYLVDLTAVEVVEILEEYFGINSWIETEVTIDRIKYELARGNPIIIPAAGRDLGNPYFQNPGPIYHMLVIRGYNKNEFITNDVGTNTKGEALKYKQQVIIDSIHDWWHKPEGEDKMTAEEIRLGRKVMVVIDGSQ